MFVNLTPGQTYELVFDLIVFLLSIIAYNAWVKKDVESFLHGNNTQIWIIVIFCIAFTYIVGNRPTNAFGDTYFYAHSYELARQGLMVIPETQGGDWLFNLLMVSCAHVMDSHAFFTIVEAGYIFFALWGLTRIFGRNTWGAFLFFIGAFSFFTYGVNGIRNGLATSIVILAFSFLLADKPWEKIIGLIWCFIAISIHKSAMLPCACMIISLFIRDPKFSVGLWITSILLYLVAGNAIGEMFASLGFDDRMANYMNNAEEYAKREKSGFRPDFLIYSAMPIWLGYEVLIKRKIQSKYFPVLFNTYIFANSFWVMVMGVAFSNRFAYLSWFMYPIVLAYPCLKLNVWGSRQGTVSATIMIAHIGFTLFMVFMYL